MIIVNYQTTRKKVITMPTKTKDLYCIKINHTWDGGSSQSFITFNQFNRSFVQERWENETRSNPKYTIFGRQFTTTKVHYSDKTYSERNFIFPDSLRLAEQLHEIHKPKSF